VSFLWRVPPEIFSTIADSVNVGMSTGLVPESSAVAHCTVVVVVTVGPRVVVTVIRGEHHVVRVDESITGVSRVSTQENLVVTRLLVHQERTVLGVEPAVITRLESKSQLVGTA